MANERMNDMLERYGEVCTQKESEIREGSFFAAARANRWSPGQG